MSDKFKGKIDVGDKGDGGKSDSPADDVIDKPIGKPVDPPVIEDEIDTTEDSTSIEQDIEPILPEEIPDEELEPYVFEEEQEIIPKSITNTNDVEEVYSMKLIDDRINEIKSIMDSVNDKIQMYQDLIIAMNEEESKPECIDQETYVTEQYTLSAVNRRISELTDEIQNVSLKIIDLQLKLEYCIENNSNYITDNTIEEMYSLTSVDNRLNELRAEITSIETKLMSYNDMLDKINSEEEYSVDDALDELI